ncbi:restriction endonuclease fold toxin 5 domain-containing protein [Burkholderia gladioli]|uniref:restriction endonuclease fold toxin 5 domain-containing protein n=1 Tax=Burkholderia gladioli TaxID=28095 RepID=UPI000F51F2A0|nr:restriction endonuclease fold toxin 5 domain-containing protein [Burkholderia gladioli]
MAFLAVPLVEGAVVEFGPGLLAAGAALVGATALTGDTPKDKSDATPQVRALPRTGESCKKCPPEGGSMARRNHGVNWTSYRYQARITGFTFDSAECRWSDEWSWEGVDFDGFQREACLLQETKGDYDQFLDEDGDPKFFFTGFTDTRRQILRQSAVVAGNPPSQLMWYFMTPRAREYLLPDLRRGRVQSVYQP